MEHQRKEILERGGERAMRELIHGIAWIAVAAVLRLVVITMMDPGLYGRAFLWAPIILGAVITVRGAFARLYVWNRTNELVEKATSDLEILDSQL
jgi:hypothetical protein